MGNVVYYAESRRERGNPTVGARIEPWGKETTMGDRVHIHKTHEMVWAEDGSGYDLKVRFSPNQADWFNNRQYDLAEWLNNYGEDIYVSAGDPDWVINKSDLEKLPEEAFKDPPYRSTEEEMRRWVAECIACADKDGEVHMEWF